MAENRNLIDFCSTDDRKKVKKKKITKEMAEVKKDNRVYSDSYDSKVKWNKDKDDWEEKKYAKEKPSEENPFVNGSFHHQKHKLLDLRWGSVYVYKTKGRYFGHGDMEHCEDEDIKWNMLRLKTIMNKCKITSIWKAYDSDMGDHSDEKHDLENILKEAEQYREQVYEIFDSDVRLIPENRITEVKKYLDSYPTPDSYDDGIIIS